MTEEEKQALKDRRLDASLAKRRAIKELDQALEDAGIANKSEWSFMEQLAQDVEAMATGEGKNPSSNEIIRRMKDYAGEKYIEHPEIIPLILEAIPSAQRVIKWKSKKNWQNAVWEKCKEEGHFTPSKKSNVLRTLYEKCVDKGDTQAIKLYLTISGDYQEKIDIGKNQAADIFKEINEQLHGKR